MKRFIVIESEEKRPEYQKKKVMQPKYWEGNCDEAIYRD